MSSNSFGARDTLVVGENSYEIFRLDAVPGTEKLPYSLKVLAENLLRTEDGANITKDHILALANWDPSAEPNTEIQFTPARVIMQDFTGVPCIVDLATMREAVTTLGGDPNKVNPLSPADMVIDHSVILDVFGRADALERNVDLEYERNGERYQFLRWGQGAFDDFKVVPPGRSRSDGGVDRPIGVLEYVALGAAGGGQAQPAVALVRVLGGQALKCVARDAFIGNLAPPVHLGAQRDAAVLELFDEGHRCSSAAATSPVTLLDTCAYPSADMSSSSSRSSAPG